MLLYKIYLLNYTIAKVYDFERELKYKENCETIRIIGRQFTSVDGKMLKHFKKVERLVISDTSINEFPSGIEELTSLKEIVFDNNDIGEKILGLNKLINLPSLHSLKLSGNKIKELSTDIGLLTQLKTLNITNNELETIPFQIEELKELTTLDLSKNNIKNLPNTINGLKSLKICILNDNKLENLCNGIIELTQLQSIFLDNNLLKKLPIQLFGLENIEKISAAMNQISAIEFPDVKNITNMCTDLEICKKIQKYFFLNKIFENSPATWIVEQNMKNGGYNLSKLATLNLSYNNISYVPNSIAFFRQLTCLAINNNEIKRVSNSIKALDNLIYLDLSCNKLQYLPADFNCKRCLYYLNLRSNNIKIYDKDTNLGMDGLKLLGIKKLLLDEDFITQLKKKLISEKFKEKNE